MFPNIKDLCKNQRLFLNFNLYREKKNPQIIASAALHKPTTAVKSKKIFQAIDTGTPLPPVIEKKKRTKPKRLTNTNRYMKVKKKRISLSINLSI